MRLPALTTRRLMALVAVVAMLMAFTRLTRQQEATVVMGLFIFALPLLHLLVLVDAKFPPGPPPPK
jgi:hypothetical protein